MTRRRKRWVWILALVGLLLLLPLLVSGTTTVPNALWPRGATEHNFHRIHAGMHFPDVDKLLDLDHLGMIHKEHRHRRNYPVLYQNHGKWGQIHYQEDVERWNNQAKEALGFVPETDWYESQYRSSPFLGYHIGTAEIIVYFGEDADGNRVVIGKPKWRGDPDPSYREILSYWLRHGHAPPSPFTPPPKPGSVDLHITEWVAVTLAILSFFLGILVGSGLVWWFAVRKAGQPEQENAGVP
jgi:hypothetical protein